VVSHDDDRITCVDRTRRSRCSNIPKTGPGVPHRHSCRRDCAHPPATQPDRPGPAHNPSSIIHHPSSIIHHPSSIIHHPQSLLPTRRPSTRANIHPKWGREGKDCKKNQKKTKKKPQNFMARGSPPLPAHDSNTKTPIPDSISFLFSNSTKKERTKREQPIKCSMPNGRCKRSRKKKERLSISNNRFASYYHCSSRLPHRHARSMTPNSTAVSTTQPSDEPCGHSSRVSPSMGSWGCSSVMMERAASHCIALWAQSSGEET